MKKLIIFFSALALISSCAKMELAEPVQNGQSNDSGVINGDLPEVLYAIVANDDSDAQTRTYVDGKSVKWHSGESISYFAGEYANVKYTMREGQYDGTVNAEFVKDGDAKYNFGEGAFHVIPEYPLAIYPYRESHLAVFGNSGISRYNISVNYAKEQTYAPDSFGKGANVMVATGSSNDDENLYFRHACGYLVIKLYGTDTNVSNITLTALGEGVNISGEATLIVEQNEPVQFNLFKQDDAYNTVTLDCSNGGQGVALGADAEHATEFWFALPPVNIEGGFEIEVTDTKGYIYTKQTTKDVAIERNKVQPMAALQFVSGTPPSNKIWYTKVEDAPAGPIAFYNGMTNPFDATITDHRYDSSVGKYVIEFATPVKTILEKAFYSTDIQTIELPYGLETIGENAFSYTQIRTITIPGSVNAIKTKAFSLCSWLESIEFLPSPTKTPLAIACSQRDFADYGPFENASFTSIKLNRELNYVDPDGNTFKADELDEGIFYNIYKDPSVSVTIGSQVRTIPDYMFCCLKFSSLTIPGTVTAIGDDVFNLCTALTSLTFEPSPTGESLTIGANSDFTAEGIFVDCPLQTISLNRQLVYANSPNLGLFSGNSLGNGITLGEQVHTLLPYMFTKSGITSLSIPATVMEIGDLAFYDCTNLSSIRFEAGTDPLTIGFQPGSDETGPFYQSPLTSIYVNRELVASESYAAARNQTDEGIFSTSFNGAVVKVTLQGNVNTISDYMFSGVNMQTIWIPREVTSIGKSAFENCSQLYGVTLSHSTPPTLGVDAFDGTLLQDEDETRWIALEDATNIESFKTATNWSEYADIIIKQIKK